MIFHSDSGEQMFGFRIRYEIVPSGFYFKMMTFSQNHQINECDWYYYLYYYILKIISMTVNKLTIIVKPDRLSIFVTVNGFNVTNMITSYTVLAMQ